MSMTNQAIEAAAREIARAFSIERSDYWQPIVTDILRRHFSAPSEPSDELPMGDARRPCVIEYGKEFAIRDGLSERLFLFKDGKWRWDCVDKPDEWLWPTRAAAVAFLRECAAQAAGDLEASQRSMADTAPSISLDAFAKEHGLEQAASEPAGERKFPLAPSWLATAKQLREMSKSHLHTYAVSDCKHCALKYAAITLEEFAAKESAVSPPSPAPAAPQPEPTT